MKKRENISFRLVSFTDAAGKYSPEAFRGGNEDNFYVDDDLTDSTTNKADQDEIIELGNLGMLMVVADGMGGMNAGEVASQIAIDTVRKAFTQSTISDAIAATAQTRQKYLEHVIKTADTHIKSEDRKDRSREGMGSTIIMAWLYDDELTISWCGDSRAYIFNEKTGIRLVSQDHSYVQELVNKGLLTYEQTFDHPQNNIITRSLGDISNEAKPESKTLKVGKGDIVLLCSDGLSGVLRDRKTYDSNGKLFPEENIEDIIRAHTSSMKECREALWIAAENGGWYDNVTAILCQIVEGPESQWGSTPVLPDASNDSNRKKKMGLYIILGILIIAAIMAAYFIGKGSLGPSVEEQNANDNSIVETTDSTPSEKGSLPYEKKEIDIKRDIEDVSKNESKTTSNSRKSVTEQIKAQDQSRVESFKGDEDLTPIVENASSEEELTPIENSEE